MYRTFMIFLCIGWFFLSTASCSKIEQPVSKTDEARHYLNQKQYKEAALLLKELLEEDPASSELKILFASALSGMAGFDFTEIFPSFQRSVNSGSSKTRLIFEKKTNITSEKEKFLEKTVMTMASEILKIVEMLNMINFIEKGQKRDLIRQAISVLDGFSIDDKYHSTAVGYSLLLNTFLAINLMRDAFGEFYKQDGSHVRLKKEFELICEVRYPELINSATGSTLYMFNALKNIKQINISRTKVASGLDKLAAATTTFGDILRSSNNDAKIIIDALEEFAQRNCS